MRIKYNSTENDLVLHKFLKLMIKQYILPLALNMLIFFILCFLSINGILRSIYEGYLNVRLYEILFIPATIIPIVISVQSIIMIYLGITKITNGEYLVNRYKIVELESTKFRFSDNKYYNKKYIIDNYSSNIGDFYDNITITNNYGTIIWSFMIKPLTRIDMSVETNYAVNFILQNKNKNISQQLI